MKNLILKFQLLGLTLLTGLTISCGGGGGGNGGGSAPTVDQQITEMDNRTEALVQKGYISYTDSGIQLNEGLSQAQLSELNAELSAIIKTGDQVYKRLENGESKEFDSDRFSEALAEFKALQSRVSGSLNMSNSSGN